MALYFLIAFILAGIINFVFSILIFRGLAEAGIKVSFYEIRWQVHKHLKTYKKITREKYGKVAFPYYGYVVSLVLLIAFAMLGLMAVGK